MMNTYWKTGKDSAGPRRVVWPSVAQLGRQLGLALLIGLIWGGGLYAFVQMGPSAADTSSPEPVSAAQPAAATEIPSPAPTSTPLPPPTKTPTTTPLPAKESAAAEVEADAPAPTDTPAPTATFTATPEPPTPAPVDEEPEQAGVSFAADIMPIMESRCIKCHGGIGSDGSPRIEEGFDARTYEALMAGSWNGSVVEPGNAEASYLVELIVSGDMPKRAPRLLPGEIEAITGWINAGAPDN
jgi:hypothetical protein